LLELLETFCAVAEAGSLTRATEALHLTQPAITRQLQALESRLGAVLLIRSPQGVVLTPLGRTVLRHAKDALAAVRACERAASEASTGRTQRLSLASGLMAMLYVLPPVLSRYREQHPEVAVDLRPAHHRAAVEWLLAYEVDAAVLSSPVHSAQIKSEPILADPLLYIHRSVRSPDAQLERVRLVDLQDTDLLVLPIGTGLHEQVVDALSQQRVTCRLVEHPTAETIKATVALGAGASILPASAVREELRLGTLFASSIAGWVGASREVRLLTRAQGKTPAPVSDFASLLREHYRAA
jgi:DNA-binding transcriptional LysR family regulator